MFVPGDIILALNGLELNTNNVNAMLGAIPGCMEVMICMSFSLITTDFLKYLNFCVVIQETIRPLLLDRMSNKKKLCITRTNRFLYCTFM